MRLNIGCGGFPLEGWVNVDLVPPADIVGDIRELEFEDVEDVNMDHSLEHISWRDVGGLLERIHGWMVVGGTIRIEVPDMREIMRQGEGNPLWFVYIYGSQAGIDGLHHPGEYHCSGFTAASLAWVLGAAGWQEIQTREFLSEHPYRPGMPCLEATASA